MNALTRRIGLAAMTLGLAIGVAGQARAAMVVHTTTISGSWLTSGLTMPEGEGVGVSVYIKFGPKSSTMHLSESPIIESDVGRIFAATSDTEGFNALAAMLTNGVDDRLALEVRPGGLKLSKSSDYVYESEFFNELASGAGGIDLSGYSIERISLTISQHRVDEVLDDEGELIDGRLVFEARLDFEGSSITAAPEPSTLAGGLLGVALAGGAWLRRRRRAA